MPMLCLAGTFRILGTEPDGDSIRFYPDDPPLGARARTQRGAHQRGRRAQLRLDGIDALETHYSPRGGGPLHQPIDLAHQARDELVRWLGFKGIERTGETVTAATPEELPGYLLHARRRRLRPLRGAGRPRRPARAQRHPGDGQGRRPAQDRQPPADRRAASPTRPSTSSSTPTCVPSSSSSRARRGTQEGRVGRRPHPEGRRRREPRHADRRSGAPAQALPPPCRLPGDQRPRRLARRLPRLPRSSARTPSSSSRPAPTPASTSSSASAARSSSSRPSPRTSSSRRRERLSRRCAPGPRRTRACAGGPGRGCRSRTPWRSPCRDRAAPSP